MAQLPRARRFQFTLNEFEKYSTLVDAIKSKTNFKAMISCKETAPSTGHVHVHIYALFNQPVRWRQVCGEHIEICRGSHKKNVEYICKNGDIIEKCNLDEVRDTKMTAQDLINLRYVDAVQLPPYAFIQWMRIKNVRGPMKKKEDWKPDMKVYYIWGNQTGIGKTKFVYDHLTDDDEYDKVKVVEGFWHDVTGETTIAWYDEFRDSDMKVKEFLNFIDYYTHSLNVKGAKVRNPYRKIFITSIQSPEKIYKNASEELRGQWLRRMEIIHIDEGDKTIEEKDKTIEETLAWK